MAENENPKPVTFPSAEAAAATSFNNNPTPPNGPAAASSSATSSAASSSASSSAASSAASASALGSAIIITPAIERYLKDDFVVNANKLQDILNSSKSTPADKLFAFTYLICMMYALLDVCVNSNNNLLYRNVQDKIKDSDPRTIIRMAVLTKDIKDKYISLTERLIVNKYMPSERRKFLENYKAVSKLIAAVNFIPLASLIREDIMERRNPMVSLEGIDDIFARAKTATEGGSHKKRRNYKKKNTTKKRTRHSRTRKNRRSLR